MVASWLDRWFARLGWLDEYMSLIRDWDWDWDSDWAFTSSAIVTDRLSLGRPGRFRMHGLELELELGWDGMGFAR